ncbi:outer membrane beta-barrel protein [Vibrio kyushuensis]|uniref:outer membrane protein n=1 Tax=Vibrio kyushuensis TaxID=2910249 RepID=UPI003D13C131
MKKLILATSIATLLSPAAMATEYFVGAGVGYHTAGAIIEDSDNGRNELKDNTVSYSVRAGAYILENHRITATANFVGEGHLYGTSEPIQDGETAYGDISFEQNEFLVSYDYIHDINDKFSLFGGATVGLVKNKIHAKATASNTGPLTVSMSGSEQDFVYGAQGGVQYKLTPTISADLQYRYMSSSSEKLAVIGNQGGEVYFKIPEYSEITFNIDFRF